MTSIFELFRIGIGPSSSHTVGPMRAAKRFVDELEVRAQLGKTAAIKVELYGSLALTGKGHGTDRALILGLTGEVPDLVEPGTVDFKLSQIREQGSLHLLRTRAIRFDPDTDIAYRNNEVLPRHPNAMRFTARDFRENELFSRVFFSIGGGSILAEGERRGQHGVTGEVAYPFTSATELLGLCARHQKPIWRIVLENEKTWRSESGVWHKLGSIWMAMKDCTHRGMSAEGVLPGGLNVRRRASDLHRTLLRRTTSNPLDTMDWINLFAIAVSEENAAGGKVVTAPTNGAAGVVPAVAHYYERFVAADEEGIYRYLLTAGVIGVLYKENASISGAEVGCQEEVGVACSMAAAGLVAAMSGTDEQAEHAAEIGMEHKLGMTCDPIGGLVQIPCIERNAFGAVKAVNAAKMAMNEKGGHKVSLDQVIRAMFETGRDMQARYKETYLGAVAVNVVEC